MKKLILSGFTFLMVVCFAQTGSTATIDLWDWAYNIDGVISERGLGDPIPAEVIESSFDDWTGLGTIEVTITGTGDHYFSAFFDHEIDEIDNTSFNEFGDTVGIAAAGQSWEIDEPGYVFGDIYNNFLISVLDNTNSLPTGSEDDVSMAMGWDFSLAAGETATIDLILSLTAPGSGFYLSQTDPDSQASIYFSSLLDITGGVDPGPSAIPEPSTMILFGLGLLGFARAGRKKLG